MILIRWLLFVPVVILSWYLALFLGIGVLGLLKAYCPVDKLVSGMCTASWYTWAVIVALRLFAGVSAVVVLLSAYLMAPGYKNRVVITVLLAGISVALWLVIQGGGWWEFITAVTCGMLTAYGLLRIKKN